MSAAVSRRRKSRGAREVLGLALAVLALGTLAALATYDAASPSYFFAPRDAAGRPNGFGAFGAALSEVLLQLLGCAAFLAPIAFAALAWGRLRPPTTRPAARTAVSWSLLGLALCALLDLLFVRIAYGGDVFSAGGHLGRVAARALTALFGSGGALLVAAVVVASVIVLSTGFSVVAAAVWLAEHAGRHGGGAVTAWRAWRERRARAAPPEEEVPAPAPRPAPRVAASPPAPPAEAAPAGEAEGGPAAPSPRRGREPVPPPAAPARAIVPPLEPSGRGYRLPPTELLNEPEPQTAESEQELHERARQITDKLREFSILGQVVAIHPGPVVTTFEFKPEAGVKYSKITGMTDDLSLALRAESVRIDRMPGRATVGVEVPNRHQATIYPRELFDSDRFRGSASLLTLALGKDISGQVFTAELDRMPHLLIAGATGAGKSVGLNGMIASILYKATPDEARFIMIDTKMIELGIYAGIPHLLIPVVTEPKQASAALKWAVREMEARYRKLAAVGVRNIAQFNTFVQNNPDRTLDDPRGGEAVPLTCLPYVVIVIDELADLMMVSSADVEESIMRLAQMARAVGLHLIIATQRPSVDVITGTIKANFPSRVAFRVSQRVDSRTIIDQQGAEHLLGRGDMLFLPPGSARLLRLHGPLITEPELARLTTYVKKMAEPVYDETVLRDADDELAPGGSEGERDEMYFRAARTVLTEGKCSITLIQRRLQLGYARAARIVDLMEQDGVVGPGEGSKPREILVGPEYLETLLSRR